MGDLSLFLDMGGYGRFVWSAFGVTLLVLVGLVTASVHSLKSKEALLAQLERETRPGRSG